MGRFASVGVTSSAAPRSTGAAVGVAPEPEDQGPPAPAGGDGRGELVARVRGGLPAADLEDGAGRGRGDPAGHGPGIIIRTAQRCPRPRMRILELADADYHLDRRRDGSGLAPGVVQRLAGRVSGQVDRRAPPVAGLAEALGGLADAYDDRGAGIEKRLAHERAPRTRVRCPPSPTIL